MIKAPLVKFQIKFRLIGRSLTLLIALALCLSLFKNLSRMRRANQRLEKAQTALLNLIDEERLLEQELKEIKNKNYLEKQARDKLGLAYEGEIILVLPDEEILKSLSPRKIKEQKSSLPDPNWKAWLNLFL